MAWRLPLLGLAADCAQRAGGQTLPRYNCETDYSSWQTVWSSEKQQFCCRTAGRGCQAEPCPRAPRPCSAAEPCPQPRPPPSPCPTWEGYDCDADFGSRRSSWTDGKKAWCCANRGVGCPESREHLAFNCDHGYSSWRSSWSSEKQDWCCRLASRGCPDRELDVAFDCRVGVVNWRRGWSDEKKAYCCQRSGFGCSEPLEPLIDDFDCDEDFANWEAGWSEEKKQSCCRSRGRGCSGGSFGSDSERITQHIHHEVVVIAPPQRDPPPPPAPIYYYPPATAPPTAPPTTPAPVMTWPPPPTWTSTTVTTTSVTTTTPSTTTVTSTTSSSSTSTVTGSTTTTSSSTSTSSGTTTTLTTTVTAVVWQPVTTPVPQPIPYFPPPTPAPPPLPPACPAPMTCNLNCYLPTAALPVTLPGATGFGYDIGVPDLELEECKERCRSFSECEAVVHTATGKGTCYGKKNIHTSTAEGGCQTQPPYVTEMVCGAPWGKCTLLGDPHITPFDRKMIGSWPTSEPDFYMAPVDMFNHGEYRIVESSSLTIRGRFGYTHAFTSAASTLGIAATGAHMGGHTLAVAYVGPTPQSPAHEGWRVMWDGREILNAYPSSFTSSDGMLNATFKALEPTDFAVRARSTIGTAPGLHPSYIFELGSDRSVQIYVLPGSDLCNVVITMRKIDGQDGFCGNFNCDWRDDSKENLQQRGLWDAVPPSQSLFPRNLDSPVGWDTRTGPSPEEVMASCSQAVKNGANCQGSPAEQASCLFDACMKASAQTLRKFDLSLPFLGSPSGELKARARTLQSAACGASLLGLAAVLYVWASRPAAAAAAAAARGPLLAPGSGSQGYSLVPSYSRDPYLPAE